jgi:hypothetical protein
MSKVVNGVFVIAQEPDDICTQCGKESELRPYGKNGARICFQCGMKDEETTKKQLHKVLDTAHMFVFDHKDKNNE